jgi:hypothetical protein
LFSTVCFTNSLCTQLNNNKSTNKVTVENSFPGSVLIWKDREKFLVACSHNKVPQKPDPVGQRKYTFTQQFRFYFLYPINWEIPVITNIRIKYSFSASGNTSRNFSLHFLPTTTLLPNISAILNSRYLYTRKK